MVFRPVVRTEKYGTPDGSDDYDSDGLTNCEEVTVWESDPTNADTDRDLLPDGQEITEGTDPLDPDSNGDGFPDGEEVEGESNPRDNESLPIDPNASLGEVNWGLLSILNETDPTGVPIGETVACTISVLNETDPTGAPIGEAVSPMVSVENQASR